MGARRALGLGTRGALGAFGAAALRLLGAEEVSEPWSDSAMEGATETERPRLARGGLIGAVTGGGTMEGREERRGVPSLETTEADRAPG